MSYSRASHGYSTDPYSMSSGYSYTVPGEFSYRIGVERVVERVYHDPTRVFSIRTVHAESPGTSRRATHRVYYDDDEDQPVRSAYRPSRQSETRQETPRSYGYTSRTYQSSDDGADESLRWDDDKGYYTQTTKPQRSQTTRASDSNRYHSEAPRAGGNNSSSYGTSSRNPQGERRDTYVPSEGTSYGERSRRQSEARPEGRSYVPSEGTSYRDRVRREPENDRFNNFADTHYRDDPRSSRQKIREHFYHNEKPRREIPRKPAPPPPVAPPQEELPDYYAILGIESSALESEIKAAARKMRIKTHPDKLKKANMSPRELAKIDETAALVGQAAETLTDPYSKSAYDTKMMTARMKRFNI